MSVWSFLPQIFLFWGLLEPKMTEWGQAALGKSVQGEILVLEGTTLITRG